MRCGHCNRLLAKGEALYLELKCPRCGAYTILRAASARPEPREGRIEMMSDAR
ncbi:Com family DNA-binding transcriptional regulator [Bilophila wadsworthia]|uniref:Com family DNA-binding transcriptional regulator n=1 Tax=Bilophila wadsworthia TaxID=35833 RepID=UPI0035202EF9